MKPNLLPVELSDLGPGELLVNETFHSIQGESSFAGRPCFFIRLAGCHLRCNWCDTEYAFHAGQRVSVEDCVRQAAASGNELVEVTGGEPLLQSAVYSLLTRLADRGHRVLLETSGAVPIDAVDPRVHRIVDWKAPGSGESERNQPRVLDAVKPGDELKVVVLDRGDYEWARDWLRQTNRRRPTIGTSIPVYFSPVHGRLENSDLAAWILDDHLPARFGVQLHKYIWPEDSRGR